MIYGVGEYNRRGQFKRADAFGVITREYVMWRGMFKRCYCGWGKRHRPDYAGNSIDPRFYRFDDFMTWSEDQVGFGNDGYELDKDILLKGNKVYGPDTCLYLPRRLNSAMKVTNAKRGDTPVGVYRVGDRFVAKITRNGCRSHIGTFDTPEEAFAAFKVEREAYIQRLATEFKDKIDPRAYEALMNYEVLITD